MLQNCQAQFLGYRRVKLPSHSAPASSQPNPHYFYEHPPPAPGPDSVIAKALLWLSVPAEQLSLSGEVAFCFLAPSRNLPGLIPWGSQHLLSCGASHTEKSAANCCEKGKWGKKVIYLRWGCLFSCPPVPIPALALLTHPQLWWFRGALSLFEG